MAKNLSKDDIRAHYMALLKTAGVDQAISELHREIGSKAEQEVFSGGYSQARLEQVTWLRELARELFDYKTAQASKIYEENK